MPAIVPPYQASASQTYKVLTKRMAQTKGAVSVELRAGIRMGLLHQYAKLSAQRRELVTGSIVTRYIIQP